MVNKKLGEKTYKILETEGTHTVASKDTRGTTRAMEFNNDTNKLVGPAELVEVETRIPKRYEDFSPGAQLVINMAEIIVPKITDYLTDKAISYFDKWLQDLRNKHEKKQPVKRGPIFTQKTTAERTLESQKAKTTGFDSVYEEYRIDMTCEEVQKELIDIFMLEVIRTKKIWKISHANIVDMQDSNGEYLDAKLFVEKLNNPEVLGSINALMENKPELLDEWEVMALFDILGRKLVIDGRFIPIECIRLKESFMLNR